MYVIIIGCDRLGSSLAGELANEGHDVSVIDSDRERLNSLGSGFNGHIIKGVEYDNDVLLDAGIKNANVFLALTGDDNINITAALVAKKIYQVPIIIASANSPGKKHIYDTLEIDTISLTQLGTQLIKEKIK